MKRHGAGPGPRVRAPTPEDLADPGWWFDPRGRGARYRAFRWMCGNLSLAKNRHDLDCGVTTVYQALKDGKLRGVRFLDRTRIPMSEIERVGRDGLTTDERPAR